MELTTGNNNQSQERKMRIFRRKPPVRNLATFTLLQALTPAAFLLQKKVIASNI